MGFDALATCAGQSIAGDTAIADAKKVAWRGFTVKVYVARAKDVEQGGRTYRATLQLIAYQRYEKFIVTLPSI